MLWRHQSKSLLFMALPAEMSRWQREAGRDGNAPTTETPEHARLILLPTDMSGGSSAPMFWVRKLRPEGSRVPGPPPGCGGPRKVVAEPCCCHRGTRAATSPDRCAAAPPPRPQPIHQPANLSASAGLSWGVMDGLPASPTAAKSLSARQALDLTHSVERRDVCFHNLPQLQ